jgi:hypothetical protein
VGAEHFIDHMGIPLVVAISLDEQVGVTPAILKDPANGKGPCHITGDNE